LNTRGERHTGAVVADGIRWLLAGLLSLAAAEKALVLLHRSAAWHPVILVARWRRRWARQLVTAGLALDVGATLALAVVPTVGGPAAASLTAVYWGAAWGLHGLGGASGCQCFFGVLNTSSRTALSIRNATIIALGILVAVTRPDATWQGGAIALTLLSLLFAMTRRREAAIHGHALINESPTNLKGIE
jgi:hypothetical protein